MPPGDRAISGAVYKLNASYRELEENPFQFRAYFVTKFAQSLRGLKPGAPVEYRGIQIGQVSEILIKELVSRREASAGNPIPVLIYLEPARFGAPDAEESLEALRQGLAEGVKAGMRASLQTGNLLTGALYINLDYYPDAPAAEKEEFDGYLVLPSIPSGLGRLEQQIGDLLGKFNDLPLDTIAANANTAMATLDGTLASLTSTINSLQLILDTEGAKSLPGELNQTLEELRKTLSTISPDTALGQSLGDSVFELNRTLRNLEELTRTLSEKPNSLVFPTESPADPIPEANPR
jgi:paraquat-inducible protein B